MEQGDKVKFFQTSVKKRGIKTDCMLDVVQLRCLGKNLSSTLALRLSIEKISYLNSLREDEQRRMTPTFAELVQAKRILDLTDVGLENWS